MKYKLTHTTNYNYTDPVPVSHNLLHLTPRERNRQHTRDQRILVRPQPAFTGRRTDYFGNPVDYFSIHEAHSKLTVTSNCRLEVTAAEPPNLKQSLPWKDMADQLKQATTPALLEAFQFAFPSARTRISEELANYARESFHPNRPILDATMELTHRIHKDFKYETASTNVNTRLEEVFEHRRGVCQDFAHVQIACLRSLGLAVRYVSGYLRSYPPPGSPRLVGADASHAWISIYAGEQGWIDFDPTNDKIPSDEHVTVSWGRDYNDVCPIQGVFVGGGNHTMSVSVDLMPLEE